MTGEVDLLDVDEDRWTEVAPDHWWCVGAVPGWRRWSRAEIEGLYGPVAEVPPREHP